MINLIPDIDKINSDFSKSVYTKFKELNFGIAPCEHTGDIQLLSFKKKLVDYQVAIGVQNAPVTNIRILTNLPLSTYRDPNQCNTKVEIDYPQSNENLVDIQTDGCITRINMNASGTGFIFTQTESSNLWIIQHNLNYKPNVYTENNDGNEIRGSITQVDTNNLTISFSSPVSGKAYLS